MSTSNDYAGGSVVAATVFGLLLPISAMTVRVWVKSRTESTWLLQPEELFARAALVKLPKLAQQAILRLTLIPDLQNRP